MASRIVSHLFQFIARFAEEWLAHPSLHLNPCILAVLVACTFSVQAQQQGDPLYTQGLKPYGAYHGGDIDSISLENGKLDLHPMLLNYPQRGDLKMSFSIRYNNPIFYILQTCENPPSCTKYLYGSLTQQGSAYMGGEGVVVTADNVSYAMSQGEQTGDQYLYYIINAPDGGTHVMGNTSGSSWRSLDASGWLYNGTSPANGTATDANGTEYIFAGAAPTIEDRNGNKITTTATGWEDSLGRLIPAPPTASSGTAGNAALCPTGLLPIVNAYAWTVPSVATLPGSSVTYTFCYASVPYYFILQYESGTNMPASGNRPMLQSIVLPNGQAWNFAYDTYLNLNQITLPTGATIAYTWNVNTSCGQGDTFPRYFSAIAGSRTVTDQTGAHEWTYLTGPPASAGATITGTVTDPAGNQDVYTMTPMESTSCALYPTQIQKYQGTSSSGTLLQTITTAYSSAPDPYYNQGAVANPINVVPTSITTAWKNGETKEIVKTYDLGFTFRGGGYSSLYGKVVSDAEYDYGAGSNGSLLKTTANGYEFQSNGSYLSANLINLIASTVITNGAGYKCAETDDTYDSPAAVGSGITLQHGSAPNSVRGNLNATARRVSSTPCQSTTSWSSSVTAKKNVYDTGEVYQSIDPLGNTTTYTYDSTGAYVTQTQAPDTNSPNLAHHITKDAYDLNTGLKTSHTDENSNPTTYIYDEMLRIQTITPPAPEGATTYTYTDTVGSLSAKKLQTISGSLTTTEYDLFDGLGRPVSHVVANGQSTPYDKTDTCYEGRGLKSSVSYPYQTSTWNSWPTCPSSQAGDSYVYDGLERMSSVTHSDSTAINYVYTGRATSVTDEGNGTRGVEKVSQVDGLDRLVSACEVTSTTLSVGTDNTPVACGQDIAATGFLTTYAYDGLNNLISVNQGSSLNPRTFTYDSLSRLITTTNPEAGNTCFGTWIGNTCTENYDANSNVLSRTRPAPNQSSSTTYDTTTYTYDTLNRIRTKTYSDGTTPSATFDYDETSVAGNTLANTTGRLSSEYTGSSSAMGSQSILSYFASGWVNNDFQCTPQNCASNNYFDLQYSYDGVGDVTGAGNPNGNGIYSWFTYSTAPRLTQIYTNWISNTIANGNLISGVLYNSFGEPSSAALYNGVNEAWGYDARGRLQSYSALAGSTTKFNLSSITYSGNSNVLSATDTVNGTWSSYTYDDFNRLIGSSCTSGCPQNQPTLGFTYAYDRYGNRWSQTASGGGSWNQPSFSFDANNRIATGMTYDAAGNISNDGMNTYTYDGENRIVAVNSNSAVYAYDAEGRRVGKHTAAANYEYLFDLKGRATTEIFAGTSVYNRVEVYAGTRHLATQNVGLGSTWFSHSDWLGTERVRTPLSGTVEKCTSIAFGDNESCTGTDVSPMHFTGVMRDTETRLDDFPARYYSSNQGRWYSPDWAAAQVPVPYADLHNPQTLNLYDYVGDDPTNHADADGHAGGGSGPNFCDGANAGCSAQGTTEAGRAEAQTAQAQNTAVQPKKGFAVLPTVAGAVDLGVGKAGVTAQGSATATVPLPFVDKSLHPSLGAEASGSLDAYAGQHTAAQPKQDKDSFVVGAFVGVGAGPTFTNAGNAPAMKTMTNTLNIDLGFGPAASISVSSGPSGVSSFTITFGYGYGAAVTETNTATATAPSQ